MANWQLMNNSVPFVPAPAPLHSLPSPVPNEWNDNRIKERHQPNKVDADWNSYLHRHPHPYYDIFQSDIARTEQEWKAFFVLLIDAIQCGLQWNGIYISAQQKQTSLLKTWWLYDCDLLWKGKVCRPMINLLFSTDCNCESEQQKQKWK